MRYATRTLRKNLGLTLVIVASLAIGIGANSAIFSVVNALLLHPLPYPNPDRLAAVWLHSPGIGIFRDWPSPGQYIDLRTENRSFEEMALAQSRNFILTGRNQPERLGGMRAQSSLLRILGARPQLGRLPSPDEDAPGKPQVVILSDAVWKRLFNSDRNIVGQSLTLNGNPFTVAGVLQPDFVLNAEIMPSEGPLDNVDVYLPLPLGADAVTRRGDENYNIVARLKPGVTVRQAQADVDVIASRIRVKDKRHQTFGMDVIGLREQVVGDVRRPLLVLLGSVALVLLIACANVANLLLTRASGRRKEIAIRIALGAGWQRLVSQLLTESVLLAVLGGAAGLGIAQASILVVRRINPGNIPRLEAIHIDGTVLAFTFAISLVTGVLFGLAPAWSAIRVDLNTTLKSGGRSGQGDGGLHLTRGRLRGLLVVAELALSLMLLIGAGLLIRSFVRLGAVPPGFNPDRVLTMQVVVNGPKYRKPGSMRQFYKEVGDRVANLPAVRSVGFASPLPLTGAVGWGHINVEGYVEAPGQELQVDMRGASENYFPTLEVPLRKGRFFRPQDMEQDAPQVVIVEENFARRFWPHEDPIGKRVWFDPKKPYLIVGVVGTVKQYSLDTEGKIAVYFPQPANYMVLRTAADPAGLTDAAIREVHAVDPDAVVYDVRTMQERLYRSMARQRFASVMLAAFAAFALLLAAVGIYGVMSYLVAQSTHDIGVRVALGARPGNILGLVVRQGMELAIAGIAVGLVGAVALTRVMASLLFGVSATDGLTFGAVALLLAAVAFVAAVIPARRATTVDPIVALREE
jgi:putative ABC transport system permease protein